MLKIGFGPDFLERIGIELLLEKIASPMDCQLAAS